MEIKEIAIDKIKPDRNQPRKEFDREKLREMTETFKTQGAISPIEIDQNNIIVTGELRWRASKLAGLKKIPYKIWRGTPEQRLERQLVENFNRQDMDPLESIEAINKYRKLLGPVISISEIARRLGKSDTWIRDNIKFEREAPKELKKAVKEKKISVSVATEVMRAEPEEREEITQEILEESEVPEHRRIRERIKEKKELKKLKEKQQEIKKQDEMQIKVLRSREIIDTIRRDIKDTEQEINKMYYKIRGIRKTKFYFYKAKEKEDFFKLVNATIERVDKWSEELKRLSDDLEMEVVRE